VSKTDTRFPPSKRWRNSLAHLRSRCTNSYDGEEPSKLSYLPKRKAGNDIAWGSKGKDARLLANFCRVFSRLDDGDLGMVLYMAKKMARRKAV
jgi:hypothetical protein